MKKIAFTLILLLTCGIFVACDDFEKEPIPPTFKGFTYSPNPLHPGDTVTVTAVYARKGKYVYKPRCTWKITLDTLDAVSNTYVRATINQQRTASIGEENLSQKFVIPTSAKPNQKADCHFDVAFDNAVDASNVGFTLNNTTEEGYLGKFNPSVVNSVLYCHTSGSFQMPIAEKQP